MSVIFLLRSEDQVRSGAKWCREFADELDADIVPVVLGTDLLVLEKHAQSVLSELLGQGNKGAIDVQTVAPTVEDVLNFSRDHGCRLLVIPYTLDLQSLQQKLFEASPFPVVWLNSSGDPPLDESHLMGGFRPDESETNRISSKLLGMRPGKWAIGQLPPSELDFDKSVELLRKEFDDQALHPDSLILVTIESTEKDNVAYAVSRKLLNQEFGTSVILVRKGQAVVPGMFAALRHWMDSVAPSLTREQRIALQEDLESGSIPSIEFLGLISASSMLAAFGLLQNSAAVIIGAMLIAPLMTPIMGAGLAITLGNRPLFRNAISAIGLGLAGAFFASMLFGGLVRVFQSPDLSPEQATEMWARCDPSPIDFCVGLIGGMAAAYARTRSHLSSALAGAAIAAALVPPLSTAGLQVVCGYWQPTEAGTPIIGPLLIVSINVLTIMVGTSLVLWLRGIRSKNVSLRKQDRWAIRMAVIAVGAILLVLVGMVEAGI
ncbi:DUF389 domain-containing protein [Stieleria sp. TO1_6]|uniref:DUF389 domain-containing protein n=1 Tax=Stieleria tagensis TaxID=2956795 RepID=UPI00209A64FF|nr:DUF389 domain-containing protein [Stieleria tagensis]MCO8123560.1 DUF389 domain-containing protein [Stieleria tagensis]